METAIVIIVVMSVALYLGWEIYKALKGGSGGRHCAGGCGSCDCKPSHEPDDKNANRF